MPYITLLCVLFLTLAQLPGLAIENQGEANEAQQAEDIPAVFTGGVFGIEDIVDADNSTDYRAAGGGLYLHNNGWHRLSEEQRAQALALFAGRPIAVELGFNPIDGWPGLFQREYLPFGIEPAFIAANAFDRNNRPTPEQWARYSRGLREAGVGDATRILPTFEYANFGENLPTLSENHLSTREDFQAIVQAAGGIVLDTPPQYFFAREQAYRDWVIDAIRWCNDQGLYTVVIVSPHNSGDAFARDTDRFTAYLEEHGAHPNAWVCENYVDDPPAGYPNRVGYEDGDATTLGVGLRLLQQLIADAARVNEERDDEPAE